MRSHHVLILSLLAMLMVGCNGIMSNGKSTLFVDLTVVAKALGRNEMVNTQLASAEKQLNEQLKAIAIDLNKQVKDKQKTLTKKSKDKDKQRVNEFAKQAQQTMQNRKSEAQKKINQLKINLVNKFRDDVKAVAEPIAKKAGAKSVMVVSADALWFDSSVDITDEVIAKMREVK